MAYRPLIENDRVKIMQKGHFAFGTFGTVLSTNGDYVDVMTGSSNLRFLQKDLMVASETVHGFYTLIDKIKELQGTVDYYEDGSNQIYMK